MVAGGMQPGGSSCLSVFGLAYDATEREVHVLFSGCPGYCRCIVVPGKGSQRPYAFVQFGEQQDALGAMESRQGTTWEDGGQPVSIEIARRDIPEKFQPRQMRGGPPQAEYGAAPPRGPAILPPNKWEADYVPPQQSSVVAPPNKRPRQELGSQYGASPTAEADGPRTLHLGGLPLGLTQVDLDAFLTTNFGSSVVGGNLDTKGGTSSSPRAFVGFTTHRAAAEAQAVLEGFGWDGAVMHAEWARTEFRAQGAVGSRGGGNALAISAPMTVPPRNAPVGQRSWETAPVGQRGWEAAPPGQRSWEAAPQGQRSWEAAPQGQRGWEAAPQYEERSGAKCTLHFTNLPFITEGEFSNFLGATFPEQIVCAHFKDLRDGRPPVAWVLFTDEFNAATAASSHHNFDLQGSQVLVQYARTELDPSKFRR